MRRSIVYLAVVTVAMSSVLSSQASAKKSSPNLYSATATGKHIKEGEIKLRTTTGSPGPKGSVGTSSRDATTGLPSGQRTHEQFHQRH
jgi:hypothetical protein